MLDQKRLRLLWVAQRKINLCDDDFRRLIALYGKDCPNMCEGKPSTKHLTLQAFDKLMMHFEDLGFVSTAKKKMPSADRRPGAATPLQIILVNRLWQDFTRGKGNQRSLGVWLEQTFKVSSVHFMSFNQARKTITALKKMNARQLNLTQVDA